LHALRFRGIESMTTVTGDSEYVTSGGHTRLSGPPAETARLAATPPPATRPANGARPFA